MLACYHQEAEVAIEESWKDQDMATLGAMAWAAWLLKWGQMEGF